ncbi:MAG TPA: DoxX family protein [Candidatus Sulfotelmatobacter sp.]|nr:DoxX family protein [Candidatus Sulfotelmatobacter sp.]
MTSSSQIRRADVGLFLIRAVLAAVFMYHGGQKLFGLFGGHGIQGTAGFMASIGIPFPTLSTILAGSAEFFGGIVLLLGTGTRIAAVPMALTMLVAVATVHRSGFGSQAGGMEFPLTLGVVLAALVLTGPGRLTLGRLITARAQSEAPSSHPVAA